MFTSYGHIKKPINHRFFWWFKTWACPFDIAENLQKNKSLIKNVKTDYIDNQLKSITYIAIGHSAR